MLSNPTTRGVATHCVSSTIGKLLVYPPIFRVSHMSSRPRPVRNDWSFVFPLKIQSVFPAGIMWMNPRFFVRRSPGVSGLLHPGYSNPAKSKSPARSDDLTRLDCCCAKQHIIPTYRSMPMPGKWQAIQCLSPHG